MLHAALKLLGFTLLGYIIFQPRVLRDRVLPLLTTLVVSFMFPLYSVTRYGMGWSSALDAGAFWMLIFFAMGVATLFLQYSLARFFLNRTGLFSALNPDNRGEFILLFSIHNAGYIPLPILQAVAPPEVTVYMFSYILAFQLIFWSFAVGIIQNGGMGRRPGGEQQAFRIRIRLNPPLAGLLAGLILAATGIYPLIPEFLRRPAEVFSGYAMDGILVVLGGILAGIPHHQLKRHREFIPFSILRQLLIPAAVLVLMVLLRLIFDRSGLFPGHPLQINETWRWMQLVLVLEAAAPPATNLAIAVKAFGTEDQLNYIGTGLILSYLASAVALPLLVMAALFV